ASHCTALLRPAQLTGRGTQPREVKPSDIAERVSANLGDLRRTAPDLRDDHMKPAQAAAGGHTQGAGHGGVRGSRGAPAASNSGKAAPGSAPHQQRRSRGAPAQGATSADGAAAATSTAAPPGPTAARAAAPAPAPGTVPPAAAAVHAVAAAPAA